MTINPKRIEFYPKIESLIQELGEWNVNCLELSKEWRIPERTLNRWKNQIVDKRGPLKLDLVANNLQVTMISNIKLCQRQIRIADSLHKRMEALKVYNELIKGFTEFLEKYGYKNKVADKIEHIGSIPVQINLIERSIKDIKKDKEEKLARIKDDTINNQS